MGWDKLQALCLMHNHSRQINQQVVADKTALCQQIAEAIKAFLPLRAHESNFECHKASYLNYFGNIIEKM